MHGGIELFSDNSLVVLPLNFFNKNLYIIRIFSAYIS